MNEELEEKLYFIEDCLAELGDSNDRCIMIHRGNRMEQKVTQEWLRAGLIIFRETIGIYDIYDLNA